MKSYLFVIFLSLFLLSGCGGGGSTSPTVTPSATITGTAVDGYISGATVCLDTNKNNACDSGEPSTTTNSNGTYSLDVEVTGTYPILMVGGTDTATNKPFVGILKDVVELNESTRSIFSTITPLTTIATEIYQQNSTSTTPAQAKQKLATSLGIELSQVSKDPMTDTTVFAKSQSIIQTIELLSSKSTSSDANTTFKSLASSIATSINENNELNTTKVVTKVTEDKVLGINVTIDTNTITFIDNLKNELEAQSTTTSVTNLATLQSTFTTAVTTAKVKIINNDTSTLSTVIATTISVDPLRDLRPPQVPSL